VSHTPITINLLEHNLKKIDMAKLNPERRQVKLLFTDTSKREYKVTAKTITEAEEVFDLIYNTMEQSVTDILRKYNVGKQTKVWVEYTTEEKTELIEE
tara:strand:+ start:23343 stop:23636 length:294 start_codon:yes stop_codon:yes gene_type:complete